MNTDEVLKLLDDVIQDVKKGDLSYHSADSITKAVQKKLNAVELEWKAGRDLLKRG